MRGDFRDGLLFDDLPVTTIPGVRDPSWLLDGEFALRSFCCPGCQVLMETEVVRVGDERVPVMRLA
jgi:N-methylhydantoinase B